VSELDYDYWYRIQIPSGIGSGFRLEWELDAGKYQRYVPPIKELDSDW